MISELSLRHAGEVACSIKAIADGFHGLFYSCLSGLYLSHYFVRLPCFFRYFLFEHYPNSVKGLRLESFGLSIAIFEIIYTVIDHYKSYFTNWD